MPLQTVRQPRVKVVRVGVEWVIFPNRALAQPSEPSMVARHINHRNHATANDLGWTHQQNQAA
ncbi:hypothetical protein [Rhizobium sp. Nf11,1]|uniref:hypothetical protein n=1 Tax=Rhizobium sp. Nf11,1 TaxID=3404923 RepID=UPI003D326C10